MTKLVKISREKFTDRFWSLSWPELLALAESQHEDGVTVVTPEENPDAFTHFSWGDTVKGYAFLREGIDRLVGRPMLFKQCW